MLNSIILFLIIGFSFALMIQGTNNNLNEEGMADDRVFKNVHEARKYFDLNLDDNLLFERFKLKYNKNYKDLEEESKRKMIFINNLKELRNRNSDRFGINIYADCVESELPHSFLSINENNLESKKTRTFQIKQQRDLLPDNYFACDTKGDNLCGEGVYQGDCGSCYACSIANNMQIQYAFLTKNKGDMKKEVFSAQQIIDCSYDNFFTKLPLWLMDGGGCKGGNLYLSLMAIGSFTPNSSYPYEDHLLTCKSEADFDYETYKCKAPKCDGTENEIKKCKNSIYNDNFHKCRDSGKNMLISHNRLSFPFRRYYSLSWTDIKTLINKKKKCFNSYVCR